MKKKNTRKRKILPVILLVLVFLMIAAAVIVLLFRTREIEVEGSTYYSENTITAWVQNDKLAVNTLYVMAKYELLDGEVPSGVESFQVSLKNPWTIRVEVKEKEMTGYVDIDGTYLYFDENGTAIFRSKRLVDGVPRVEGLSFDASKAELGKKLPVEDDSIFKDIADVSQSLKEYSLTPDRMSCAEGSVSLYFGVVEVILGDSGYDVKIRQIEPILAKLNELYPNTSGALHLENYTSESDSVRFVPAK